MITKQSIDSDEVMSQLSAVSVCLAIDYKIVSVTGDSGVIGVFDFELNQNVFDFLPQSLKQKVKNSIEQSFSTKQKCESSINYIDIYDRRNKLKVISSVKNVDQDIFFLVTFLALPIADQVLTKYESYQKTDSKLKLNEDRLTNFFEDNPLMHIGVDPYTGTICYCNNYVINKLGYSSKKDLMGKPLTKIFTKESKIKSKILLEKFKKDGHLDNHEVVLQTITGKEIPVMLYTIAARDQDGKILYSRSTLVDISELKNIQNRLEEKQANLELLNNELEQFVSTCSHDLQEPLATIKFANDILGKFYGDQLDEKAGSYIKYINQAADRLSNQIKALLVHAKIGKDAEIEEVDTKKLMDIVIEDLGKRIDENKAVVSISGNFPKIEGYEVELRLLFQNLVSNAIKYVSPNKIPKINIEGVESQKNVKISIKDNGIGISKRDIKEIFKIFNRVNDDNFSKGTGVGLAHCDKIIRMHKGTINVVSKEKEGSVFTVKLKKRVSPF